MLSHDPYYYWIWVELEFVENADIEQMSLIVLAQKKDLVMIVESVIAGEGYISDDFKSNGYVGEFHSYRESPVRFCVAIPAIET